MIAKPWERQPKETEVAYQSFRTFLYMQPPRTYKKVAEALGVSLDNIKLLGAKYKWRVRAQQYDSWMAGQADEARIDAIRVFQAQIITEEVEDYQKLRRVWQEHLDRLLADETLDGGEFITRMKKLVAMRSEIDALARRAAALPNTYRATEVTNEPKELDQPMMLTLDGPRLLEAEDDGTDE